MNTSSTINKILIDLGVAESDLQPGRLLKRDLKLDSTDTVQIALDIQKRFGVSVRIESAHDLSVAQLCELVDGLKKQETEGAVP